MKKLFNITVALLGVWLIGIFWAAAWIDGYKPSDFPSQGTLAIARFFWSIAPSIDISSDADRALKLSWLSASVKINKREKKEVDEIMKTLRDSFSLTSSYLKRHESALLPSTKARAVVQLLTYLNRVELFDTLPNSELDLKLSIYFTDQKIFSPSVREDWQREMMIRARLKNDHQAYRHYRTELIKTLEDHEPGIPASFLRGAVAFYDGVLSCIVGQDGEAVLLLEQAAKELSAYPRFTTNLLNQDLNVLLLGRGMQAGSNCDSAITKVIYSGD